MKWIRISFAMAIPLLFCSSGIAQNSRNDVRPLTPGQAVERDSPSLLFDDGHAYSIGLREGEFLHVSVEQRGVDVLILLYGPRGNKILAVDSSNGSIGPESLSYIASKTGKYRVVVRSLIDYGKYAISVESPRIATSDDEIRVAAERRFGEGRRLHKENKSESLQQAIVKYQEAITFWHKLNEPYWEALTLHQVAFATWAVSNGREKALDFFTQALQLWRSLGDRHMEGTTLYNSALIKGDLGQKRQAIEDYRLALAIAQELIKQTGKQTIFGRESPTKLLEEALRISENNADRAGVVAALCDLGWIHSQGWDRDESFKYYKYALNNLLEMQKSAEKLSHLTQIESAFNDLEKYYDSTGSRSKHIEVLNQLLIVKKEAGDRPGEATVLVKLALAFKYRDEKKADEIFEQALGIWRSLKDKAGESATLDEMGETLFSRRDYNGAFDRWNQALAASRDGSDKEGEVKLLFKIANVRYWLKQFNEAVQGYGELLKVPVTKNVEIEVVALNNIGLTHLRFNRYSKAQESFENALLTAVGRKSTVGQVISLNNLGEAHRLIGELDPAISYYLQAKTLFSGPSQDFSISDIDESEYPWTSMALGEAYESVSHYERPYQDDNVQRARGSPLFFSRAAVLNNLALAYYSRGDYYLAKKYYEEAYRERQSLSPGNGSSIALILNNLGLLYKSLARYDKALDYYRRSLNEMNLRNDQAGKAVVLNNLGGLCESTERYEQARDYYLQALRIVHRLRDRRAEGASLNNLAQLYLKQNKLGPALKLCKQSLNLRQQTHDRSGEADTLNNIGSIYKARKEYERAIAFYEKSLFVRREVGDRAGEATTLHNLMLAWEARRVLPLAVLFGKQAVNTFQTLRIMIATQSFIRSKADTYRKLADLLVEQGRLPEAQQVLGMLKGEELSNFALRDASEISDLAKRADLLPDEKAALERYLIISSRVTNLGREFSRYEEMRRNLRNGRKLSAEDQARYDELKQNLEDANEAFALMLKQLEAEFGQSARSVSTDVKQNRALQGQLQQWGEGVVALYTIVGKDRYRVILTTPTAQLDGKADITAKELNRKIAEFRAAVTNKDVDPRPLAKELYDILIKPIEKYLEGAGAKTLLWSLDGALRYLPLAALHDGNRYMAERYCQVIITLASLARLSETPRTVAEWRGLGLGVSQETEVVDPVTNKSTKFSALPAVPEELSGIIRDPVAQPEAANATHLSGRGILPGRRLLDQAFTEESFKDILGENDEQGRPFSLVHIASHFNFRPGDLRESFLLLGNGRPLSLRTITKAPELKFDNVELLTLSACNTAVTINDATGTEVENFGAIVQERGAKAVMATLWAVADESTSEFMRNFYSNHATTRGITKAEALRQAQLALLNGSGRPEPGKAKSARAELVGGAGQQVSGPRFISDPARPYAHPYYWAPFILIGNWR